MYAGVMNLNLEDPAVIGDLVRQYSDNERSIERCRSRVSEIATMLTTLASVLESDPLSIRTTNDKFDMSLKRTTVPSDVMSELGQVLNDWDTSDKAYKCAGKYLRQARLSNVIKDDTAE